MYSLSPRSGSGVAWVEGTDFRAGTIEVDVRGRESLQQNYVGIAFHRKNDTTYEAVFLRPFNFRAADPVHKHHAVQTSRCRSLIFRTSATSFPRNSKTPSTPQSCRPTGSSSASLLKAAKFDFCGTATEVTLEVRKLRQLNGGQVGLWVGNVSGGDFANLVVTATK